MPAGSDDIDAVLPQTQCTRCGYEDCFAYARAIASGEAHNRCPPGGQQGVATLANLLGRDMLPLNPENGTEKPKEVAVIDESMCIGCKKCIQACPVDAIVGTTQAMHTVIAADCTGCGLCVEPCPMDCITMQQLPASKQPENLSETESEKLRRRYRFRHRLRQQRLEKQQRRFRRKHQHHKQVTPDNQTDKKAYIAQALAQFRNKKKRRPARDASSQD